MANNSKFTRGQFLKGAAASVPAVMIGANAAKALAAGGSDASAAVAGFGGKNVVLFITDQQRAIQNFPKGWAEKNLPGQMRLAKNGLTFRNAFTNSCMCSPSRATLLTGFLPPQHQVRHTLESDMNNTFDSDGNMVYEYPNVELSTDLENMCTVMAAAGYNVVWKGKFHLTKQAVTPPNPLPAPGTTAAGTVQPWVPEDVGKYGGQRWNPKDAGADQSLPEGGGNAESNPDVPYSGGDNDGRFMKDDGNVSDGDEGVLAYIRSVAATQAPFFLVVSLVNPHDVLFYPKSFDDSKYPSSDLEGDIQLPGTVNESLETKPKAQSAFRKIFLVGNPIFRKIQQRRYVNFYGALLKKADAYLVQMLDALEAQNLLDDTVVIGTSDHGEMGMSHGGVGQKSFNFYEESIRVPLIYSNPKLFPQPRTTDALVSHVDLLPTLATLFGAPAAVRTNWNGVDYSKLLVDSRAKGVQDYVVFTYDDYQSGQASKLYPKGANHISSIREKRWKMARYYDPLGVAPSEYEMYDLKNDPNEKRNLAAPGFRRSVLQQREYRRLKQKLARVEATRLRPIPGTPQTINMTASTSQTKNSKTFRFTDKGTCIGMPTGSGNTLIDWVLNPDEGTGAGKVTLSSGAGLIKGVAKITFAADPSSNRITLTGTMDITGGTGDFRGIKATGLNFVETDNLEGTDGQITITGNATYK